MPPITGHTRLYAVLGHPIGHTLSPAMHNASFAALGLDALYVAFDVPPDRLMAVLPAMAEMGFGGVNLTVPLKEVAFRGLADLDETARRLGAVNTVEFVREASAAGGACRMRGHNTDGDGFLRALQESFGGGVQGRSIFMLGCGGAGRAVAITCAAHGAARLTLADVDEARCTAVAAEIAALAPKAEVAVVAGGVSRWPAPARAADIVVQATPVGMKPGDVCPLPPDAFRAGQWAFDLVYHIPETVFMRAARQGGAAAANGLGMLLHQGARAFTIWSGREADVEAMRRALASAVYGG